MTTASTRTTVREGPAARRVAGYLAWLALPGFALQGCGSLPPAPEIAAVRQCKAQACEDTSAQADAAQVLQGLYRLLQRNDGAPLQLCEADPKTGDCVQDDVGYFVLGGVLPGRGSASTATMSRVQLDEAQQRLQYRMAMSLRFLGGDVRCEEHDATLAVQSPSRIAIRVAEHGCNWMVVGIMKASFAFDVEAMDLERGRLSGWWRHGVTGTGNGQGQGYATIRFPNPLPPREARADLPTDAPAPR